MHGHDHSRKLSANLYVLLCVQWKTPDDGQRNCPKHVEFYSKNKFEELVHVVGFIIRINIEVYRKVIYAVHVWKSDSKLNNRKMW